MDVNDGQRHRPGAAQLLRGLESGSGVFSAGIEDLYRWDYGTRVNCSSTRREGASTLELLVELFVCRHEPLLPELVDPPDGPRYE